MIILITIFFFRIDNLINWFIPVPGPLFLVCDFEIFSKFDQFVNDLWSCNLVLRDGLACHGLLDEFDEDDLMWYW